MSQYLSTLRYTVCLFFFGVTLAGKNRIWHLFRIANRWNSSKFFNNHSFFSAKTVVRFFIFRAFYLPCTGTNAISMHSVRTIWSKPIPAFDSESCPLENLSDKSREFYQIRENHRGYIFHCVWGIFQVQYRLHWHLTQIWGFVKLSKAKYKMELVVTFRRDQLQYHNKK